MSKEKQIFPLIRFSDSLLQGTNTCFEHNKIVETKGYVWFGKMGGVIGLNYIEIINSQIKKSNNGILFFAQGNRKKTNFYQAKLYEISRKKPKDYEEFPPYYIELGIDKFIKTWFKIEKITRIEIHEIQAYKVKSSVLPITDTLIRSSSGHFFISKIE